MKNIADPASSAATLDPRRCQFSFADGRRCRLPRWETHPTLCVSHARPGCGLYLQPTTKKTKPHLESEHTPNLADELGPLSGQFNTATDVNHALGNLFSLLAQNRIPRRNAVALGYLAQLLLQTLPGVREELTQCCGEEAWDETLESIFCEDETEDETEAEAENTNDSELLPVYEGDAQPAFECQPPLDKIDGQEGAPAHSELPPLLVVAAPTHSETARAETAHTEAALTETQYPQVEIAPEPKPEEIPDPEEFVAQPLGSWSYWQELERNEHLRKTRH